jgi:hypothetical protein
LTPVTRSTSSPKHPAATFTASGFPGATYTAAAHPPPARKKYLAPCARSKLTRPGSAPLCPRAPPTSPQQNNPSNTTPIALDDPDNHFNIEQNSNPARPLPVTRPEGPTTLLHHPHTLSSRPETFFCT